MGIDPETVRLVAQCLNHYATPGPLCKVNNTKYFPYFQIYTTKTDHYENKRPDQITVHSYCGLCILIVRPCILNVLYVFLLWSMYSYCSSMYS